MSWGRVQGHEGAPHPIHLRLLGTPHSGLAQPGGAAFDAPHLGLAQGSWIPAVQTHPACACPQEHLSSRHWLPVVLGCRKLTRARDRATTSPLLLYATLALGEPHCGLCPQVQRRHFRRQPLAGTLWSLYLPFWLFFCSFWGGHTDGARGSPLAGLGEPYGASGMEPRLAVCKASVLPSLWSPL